MEYSNIERQVDEIEHIFETFSDHNKNNANINKNHLEPNSCPNNEYQITLLTPNLFTKLQQIVSTTTHCSKSYVPLHVKKCLSLELQCAQDWILRIEFPWNYPLDSVCDCTLFTIQESSKDVCPEERVWMKHEDGTSKIEYYLSNFQGTGLSCVDLVLEYVLEYADKDVLRKDSKRAGMLNDTSPDRMVSCYVLRYNHLLQGAEHKKEKSMLDVAKKFRLHGGVLWGTPGFIIIVPPSSTPSEEPCTSEVLKSYISECRAIGKRVLEYKLHSLDVTESSIPFEIGKFVHLSMTQLRLLCHQDETLVREVLGVQ